MKKRKYTRRTLPSQSILAEHFEYDMATGDLYRKFKNGNIHKIVSKNTKGYLILCFNYKTWSATNVIWKLVYGEDADVIDHRNGVVDCNLLSNLRNCSKIQNSWNRQKINGVYTRHYKKKTKYESRIKYKNKNISLGTYESHDEALAVRVKAERLLFGEHAPRRSDNSSINYEFSVPDKIMKKILSRMDLPSV